MKLAGHGADAIRQRDLEVQVDVLEGWIPFDRAGRNVLAERGQPCDQRGELRFADQARPRQAADVGDRARDVVGSQLPVDIDGAREVRDTLVVLLAEAPAPDPLPTSVRSWAPILPGWSARHAHADAPAASGTLTASVAVGSDQRDRLSGTPAVSLAMPADHHAFETATHAVVGLDR